jgi:hypothetical protein
MFWLSCNCFDYLIITPLCFDYFMYVVVFSTLGQRWLVSIQSLWRGRPETATRGLLLPRATLLLLPCATRWETLATAPLLLPCVCMRWEAPAAAALLLLTCARRRLHRMTRWRCGWRLLLLLLQHAWRSHLMTSHRTPRTTTTSAPTSKKRDHMNTASRF